MRPPASSRSSSAIRSTGTKQPIVLGGIDYNADLSQLLRYLPSDPARQLVASGHIYDFVQGKDATRSSTISSSRSQSGCR